MKKIIISAVSQNGVIGKNGDLPWHSKEEFQHFKNTTYGHPVIMGRKTFESLGKPLKGRQHLVVSRNKQLDFPFEEVKVFHNLKEALQFCENENYEKVFVIGGGEIYKQAIDLVDKMIISYMHLNAEGDTFFPEIDKDKWTETNREKRSEFDIVTYERKEEN